MSVKVMGMVWDADLPRNQKMVLLAYADHADHDGRNVFPSVGRVAWKTGYSERAVQRITRELEGENILIPDGAGPAGQNKFRINIKALPDRADYGGDKMSGGGDKTAPRGVTNGAKGGDKVSPKPSVNNRHREPSPAGGRAGEIFTRAETLFGGLNAEMADKINADIDDYGMLAVEDALREAEKNGARKWEYITAILRRWHDEGRGADFSENGRHDAAEEAWKLVEEALRAGNADPIKEHGDVVAAVTQIGGWPKLRDDPESEKKWNKRAFLEAYNGQQ